MGDRVMVTGHRPQHLRLDDGYWLQGEFDRIIAKLQPDVAVSGMALGVDQWWADAALHAGVPLHAFLPFPEQDARWRDDDRTFYRSLLSQAAEVVTVCPAYSPAVFQRRNVAMVDASTGPVVAGWTGKARGGTWNCVEYAQGQGRDLLVVDPIRRVTTMRRARTAA